MLICCYFQIQCGDSGCPYNDLVISRDSDDCLEANYVRCMYGTLDWLALHLKFGSVYI